MPHPFETLAPTTRKRWLVPLSVAAAVLLAVLVRLYVPLQNDVAPQGMASLETAGSLERLNAILASWSEPARRQAAFSLGLNFLCLFAMVNALALGCVSAAQRVARRTGILLAWGQWLAGLLWLIENSLLAAAVLGSASNFGIAAASAMAMVKLALVGAGLVYAVGAGIVGRRKRAPY